MDVPHSLDSLLDWAHPDCIGKVTPSFIIHLRGLDKVYVLAELIGLRGKFATINHRVHKLTDLQLRLKGTLRLENDLQELPVNVLLDSGCTHSTINQSVVDKYNLTTIPLAKPMGVRNADGSTNIAGLITHVVQVQLEIKGHKERLQLSVSNLGEDDLFLGYDWLLRHNPDVDWTKKTLAFTRCEAECSSLQSDEDYVAGHIRAFATKSTELAAAVEAKKAKRTLEQMVPPALLDY
jgi:hypothetical protein